MKLTIITPCFNSAETIKETLESVASQSYADIEQIVIDGNSSDNTIEIAKEYPHISKIVSEKDKGIYDAINKGIKISSGEIIGILNSDDFYANELVLEKVATLFKNKKVDAVYGDLDYVSAHNISKIVRKWRSGEYDKRNFLNGWMPPHPTFFIRKECYEKYGLFNTELSISADYELMLRMLYKHHISCAYIPGVLVHMRTGGKSNNGWRSRWLANQQDRMAWKMNGLKPELLTLWKKPLKKVLQYLHN